MNPEFPTLLTSRLRLRKLSEQDVAQIYQSRSNPEINKYLDRKPCGSLEDAQGFINSILADKTGDLLYWAITESQDDTLLGTVCLFGFSADKGSCEIGYELFTSSTGKGIMAEAVRKVIAYASEALGVKTIEAETHRENHKSTNLLEKVGFKKVEEAAAANADLLLYRSQCGTVS